MFSREQLLDEGWLGPDPVAGDLPAASATSCSRPATASAFVDPDAARARRGLRRRHGSLTAAEMQVPLLAARGRDAAVAAPVRRNVGELHPCDSSTGPVHRPVESGDGEQDA